MKFSRDHGLAERRTTATDAKAALLQAYKAAHAAADPEREARMAERAARAEERVKRHAERDRLKAEEKIRAEHFTHPDQYGAYYDGIAAAPVLWHPGSARYAGAAQLEVEGLMQRGLWPGDL